MSALRLHLESSTQYERIDGVLSFVGEDASGSFGILPGHAPFLTVLEFGLARFRTAAGAWEYVAAPGAVVLHRDGDLHFSARHYLRGSDHEQISAALREQLLREERSLHEVRRSLQQLENGMLKRLLQLGRGEGAS
jgi:F-type H+-transporting ATPase subunit epsilon